MSLLAESLLFFLDKTHHDMVYLTWFVFARLLLTFSTSNTCLCPNDLKLTEYFTFHLFFTDSPAQDRQGLRVPTDELNGTIPTSHSDHYISCVYRIYSSQRHIRRLWWLMWSDTTKLLSAFFLHCHIELCFAYCLDIFPVTNLALPLPNISFPQSSSSFLIAKDITLGKCVVSITFVYKPGKTTIGKLPYLFVLYHYKVLWVIKFDILIKTAILTKKP